MKPKACIILPCYNEAKNIESVLKGIFNQSDKVHSHELHVLVVDDNSPDNTQKIVRELMKNNHNLYLLTGEKNGLGEAYKRGMDHAVQLLSPDLIFEMDADGQHDPDLIPLFIVLANNGFTLVIGSRFAPGGSTPDFNYWRKSISKIGNWAIRFLGGIPKIRDCTSGFRCIKTEYLVKCNLSFLSSRGYSFQSSLLCELLRNGVKSIEVPIEFSDRAHGKSKLSLKDQIEFLLNIPKIRFHRSDKFIKFCIVGISGVLVNLGAYLLMTRWFGVNLKLAAPFAIELSILSNFIFNNIWTFKNISQTSLISKMLKFHLIAGIAGLVNYTTFLTIMNLFGFYDVLAYLISIGSGTTVNYFLNSYCTWRIISD